MTVNCRPSALRALTMAAAPFEHLVTTGKGEADRPAQGEGIETDIALVEHGRDGRVGVLGSAIRLGWFQLADGIDEFGGRALVQGGVKGAHSVDLVAPVVGMRRPPVRPQRSTNIHQHRFDRHHTMMAGGARRATGTAPASRARRHRRALGADRFGHRANPPPQPLHQPTRGKRVGDRIPGRRDRPPRPALAGSPGSHQAPLLEDGTAFARHLHDDGSRSS